MKKLQKLSLLTILSITPLFAQEDCTELKVDLTNKEAEIVKQQNNISKLENDIIYYKETLKLLNAKISTETKNVTFKINSVIGDSNSGEVIVEGILINNGALRMIQAFRGAAFDPKGNGIKKNKMSIGNDGIRVDKLFKDIPTKFSLTFTQIIEGTPMIKILMAEYISRLGKKSDNLEVVFKNLPIQWK